MPTKVCHIIDNLRPGVGVTQVALDLMTDPNTDAVGLYIGTAEIDHRFEKLGIKLIHARQSLAIVKQLGKLRAAGFRILHVHSRKAVAPLIVSRLMGFKVVRTQHFGTLGDRHEQPSKLKTLIRKGRNQLTFQSFWITHWVAISKTSKMYIQNRWDIPDRRLTIIYNGINIGRFQPGTTETRSEMRAKLDIETDAVVLVSVGSLLRRKSHDVTLSAFAQIPEKFPNAKLIIAGEGSERQALEAQIKKLKLEQHVSLLGLRKDVPRVLAASDIFVHAATDEAFGLVVAEGMATGLPAIVFDGFGPSELVRHNVTGAVVPNGAVSAMSKAMIDLISTPQKRVDQGAAGREDTENVFSLDAMRKNYAAIYSQMAG